MDENKSLTEDNGVKIRILKRIGKNPVVQTVLGHLISLYVRFVYMTSSWTVEGHKDEYIRGDLSYLIVFWHGRNLADLFYKMKYDSVMEKKVSVLISLHRDGRIMASAMNGVGIETIDGSSKRGGAVAALDIIKALKRPGNIIALAPDGRKPGYKMTEGIIALAKKSQSPIVLSSFSVKRGIVLKTWDKTLFPFPFNKGMVKLGNPIYIPADLEPSEMEKWREILERRLTELTLEADKRIGFKGFSLNEEEEK